MEEVLLKDTMSFEIEVPYKLFETGERKEKPLMIYLHGFRQNIADFKSLMQPLMDLQAYHLFVQGPYPIFDRRDRKRVEDWGRAWYLYDGEQEQFVRSLEHSSKFLQEVMDEVSRFVGHSRTALVGYSMGGYLAGYFALSRRKLIDDLVVIGSRIKTEVFEEQPGSYDHLNVLALHGRNDSSVKSEPQRQSCDRLAQWGAHVTFKELEEGHRLNKTYLEETQSWLLDCGYK